MLKAILKDSDQIITKIKTEYELWDFFDKIRDDGKILEKFMKKADSEAIIKLLDEKKDRDKIVKKIIVLKISSDSGIFDIKEILKIKNVKINYLGSSKFSIESTAKDYKEAEHAVNKAIKQIEAKAKEKKAFFELKEK